MVIEGAQSLPLPVTSGVPQGTVLGPALFLCYINSMPEGISSSICLFADDTVIYRQINSAADHTILQQDLHKLALWEAEYSMEFHPEKCNVLRVTRSRSPSICNYLYLYRRVCVCLSVCLSVCLCVYPSGRIHVAACGPIATKFGTRMEIHLEMVMGEIKITPCDLGGIWGVLGVRK